MNVRIRALLTAGAISPLMVLAACGGPGGNDDKEGSDTLTIGISLPLTGDFSEPGKGVERGYKAWADSVNKDGGLLGKQVKLKIVDDKSSAEAVVSDYEALIAKDEVDLVFGPYSSRLVTPATRVAKEYGMLFVQPAGSAPEVFQQGFDNMFYAAPAVADQNYNYLADYILAMPEDKRPKTAAYASMDDPFAKGIAYGLKDQMEEAGVKTLVDEVYPPNTTDFGSIAAKIANSKADLLVGGTQYQDAVNVIVALQQLDYQPQMAAFSTAPTNPEFPKAIGNKTEGILAPTGYTEKAKYDSNVKFVKEFTKTHGSPPGEDEANAYTTGQVVAAAVEAVGCAEQGKCQEKLVKWLHKNEVETVVGPLSWDKDGRPQGAHMIQQFVDGDVQIVLPEQVAETDFVFPKPSW